MFRLVAFLLPVLVGGCARDRCEPQSSIQGALDAAADGDVIRVCDGEYQEQLVVEARRLTLVSDHGAGVTFLDAGALGTTVTVSDGSNLTLQGFTLLNGVGVANGGNLSCMDSTLTLTDSVLRGGTALRGGGLAADGCTLALTGNQVIENEATASEGGGAWIAGSTGSLFGNGFEANTAWFGGGAFVAGDGLVLTANRFSGNDAAYGGGLYLDGSSDVVVGTFEGNAASQEGGGIYVLDGHGSILGNAVRDNTSEFDGGGMHAMGGAPRIVGNTFEANQSSEDGGGLRLKLSAAEVTDNLLAYNIAAAQGGGGKFSHMGVSITGGAFTGNVAGSEGGGLLLDESSSTLQDTTFTENVAVDGGGLFVAPGWDPVSLTDCSFESNSADDQGGNIHIAMPGVRTSLVRVLSALGSAAQGGGLYAADSDLELVNLALRANSATEAGGGAYLSGGTATLANGVLWANAGPQGAAVDIRDVIGWEVVNSVIGSSTGSPAIHVEGAFGSWRYNNLFDNTSNTAGASDPTGSDGNVALEPMFVDASHGNFALGSDSPLRDAGDPALTDPDDSRSDIGLFGGMSAF